MDSGFEQNVGRGRSYPSTSRLETSVSLSGEVGRLRRAQKCGGREGSRPGTCWERSIAGAWFPGEARGSGALAREGLDGMCEVD